MCLLSQIGFYLDLLGMGMGMNNSIWCNILSVKHSEIGSYYQHSYGPGPKLDN